MVVVVATAVVAAVAVKTAAVELVGNTGRWTAKWTAIAVKMESYKLIDIYDRNKLLKINIEDFNSSNGNVRKS